MPWTEYLSLAENILMCSNTHTSFSLRLHNCNATMTYANYGTYIYIKLNVFHPEVLSKVLLGYYM